MNNSKLFLSGICLLVLTLAAPLTTEAQRGGGGGGGGGGGFSGGMSRGALAAECHAAASLVAEWARAARVGAVVIGTVPAIGTAVGNNWHGNNWHNGHHRGNDVIFIGSFGFPWWWGWGPSWGWGYGYPYYGYGYYPYGYGGAYSYGYGGYPYGNGYGYNNGYGNGYGAEYQSTLRKQQPIQSLRVATAAVTGWLLPWIHRWSPGAANEARNPGVRARPR